MPSNDLMGMGTGYDAAAVTPADGADLAFTGRLWVGGAGNVSLDTQYGTTVTFTGVAAGTLLPVLVRRVRAIGTTATNMVLVR
jgi:hypothetical protein